MSKFKIRLTVEREFDSSVLYTTAENYLAKWEDSPEDFIGPVSRYEMVWEVVSDDC